MLNFLSIEFLPVMAIPIFGFIFTLNSTRRYIKWIFAATPILPIAIGIYSEYQCDRSLTNVIIRLVKGVEMCPQNTVSKDSAQADGQNSSIIIAQAWFIVGQKKPGGSGKAAALEVLARYNQPLKGIDISCRSMGSGYDPSRRRYPCDTLTQLDDLDLSQTPNLDMSKSNLEGIQGEGINLSSQDLTLSNLSNSHFPNSNFSDGLLWSADLSGSEIPSTNFANADLRLAKFNDSNISSSNFSEATMGSAKLMEVSAFQTKFHNADLSDSNFGLAEIRLSQFDGANLFRANFKGAKIVRTSFKNAQLSSADFTNADIEVYNGVSSDFVGAWAWRNQEPKGLGQLAKFVKTCNFDADLHDVRFRPSNC